MKTKRIEVTEGGVVHVEESIMFGAAVFLQVTAQGEDAYVWLTHKETKKLIKALKATLKTEEGNR